MKYNQKAKKKHRAAEQKPARSTKKTDSSPSSRPKSKKQRTSVPGSVQVRNPRRETQNREELIRQSVSRNKRRHKKNYILYYILLFFILAVTGITLSLTVFFNVEQISVSGNGGISSQSLIAATGVKKGDNLFRISTGQVKKRIFDSNVTIDDVAVKRNLPSTLSIVITPAQVEAVIYFQEKYYSVSPNNRVIAISDTYSEEAPFVLGCDFTGVELGDSLIGNDQNKMELLELVLQAIETNEIEIDTIDITDLSTIKLYFQNRIEMKFGSVIDLEEELRNVKLLIETEVEEGEYVSIDATLRNGKYYKRWIQEEDIQGAPESPASIPETENTSSDLIPEDASSGTESEADLPQSSSSDEVSKSQFSDSSIIIERE